MSAAEILRRLRLFLLLLALAIFSGALVELWLVKHTEDAVQWIAFFLGGTGLLVVLVVLLRRNQTTVRILQICMMLVVAGSLFGIYQHVSGNFHLEREIHPTSPLSSAILKAFGGANPLLAPGTLAVAALLALAGTYRSSVVDDVSTQD